MIRIDIDQKQINEISRARQNAYPGDKEFGSDSKTAANFSEYFRMLE